MSCLEPLEQTVVCAVSRMPISACGCRPPPAVATARRAWGDGERARCALLAPCCASRISPCISCPRWYDDPLLEGVFSSVPACASRPDLGPLRVLWSLGTSAAGAPCLAIPRYVFSPLRLRDIFRPPPRCASDGSQLLSTRMTRWYDAARLLGLASSVTAKHNPRCWHDV